MPVTISRTIRSAASAVMSAEPTAVGITSTSSAPTTGRRRARLAAGAHQLGAGHPARLRGAGSGGEGGVEHVDVDREEDRPFPHRVHGALDDRVDAELAHLVHEDAA